jgi:hypothetical protein
MKKAEQCPDLKAVALLKNESLYVGIDVGKTKHLAGFISSTNPSKVPHATERCFVFLNPHIEDVRWTNEVDEASVWDGEPKAHQACLRAEARSECEKARTCQEGGASDAERSDP